MFLGSAGLLLAIISALAWRRRVLRRQWVRDTGSGFIILDRQGNRDVQDEDVLMVSSRIDNHYSGGALASYTRTFRAWLGNQGSAPELITMTTTFTATESDPLASLIQRLSNRLATEAEEFVRDGLSVVGEHWNGIRGTCK